ncbi:nicotinate-nicotinamide nucleotide adenylyltransferase, partial [Thermus scotoductus]|uniref:nicotinate-nicotinamide nucleotide adenylyltransferase n=1 Tax=Thermus scotoductus TaxID=37636 RepID=UPI0020A26484
YSPVVGGKINAAYARGGAELFKRAVAEATGLVVERHLILTLEKGFLASRLELDRPGPSYTVDTLREARRLFPEDELFFITGADAYRDILTWKEGHRLHELATLVAVARPGYPLEGMPVPVVPLLVPEVGISSTEIRRRIREGESIRFWVPRPVEVYLEKHGFYR